MPKEHKRRPPLAGASKPAVGPSTREVGPQSGKLPEKKIAPLVFARVMGGPTPPRAARALCEAGPAGEQVEIAPSELWARTCKNPVMHSLQPMLFQSHDGVFAGPCACALKDYTDRGLLSNSLCRLRPRLSQVSLGREMPQRLLDESAKMGVSQNRGQYSRILIIRTPKEGTP